MKGDVKDRQGKLRSTDSLPSFIIGIALNVIRELVRQKYRADSLEDYEYDVACDGSPDAPFRMPKPAARWKRRRAS